MVLILLGALLVLGGVVWLAAQPAWRSRLSRGRVDSIQDKTLEPVRPAAGFGLSGNWFGLATIGLGLILLLLGAAF